MLFFASLLLMLIGGVLMGGVLVRRMRVPGGVTDTQLGWMSPRWLAEQRTSRPA